MYFTLSKLIKETTGSRANPQAKRKPLQRRLIKHKKKKNKKTSQSPTPLKKQCLLNYPLHSPLNPTLSRSRGKGEGEEVH